MAMALLLAGCGVVDRHPAESAGVPEAATEAFARSSAALVWPATTRAFQITPAGDLYNGAWTLRVRPGAKAQDDTAAAAPPMVIAFEDGWLPVAHWERHDGSVRWSFEAFAWAAPGDTNLFVSLQVRARNESTQPAQARLSLVFTPPDSEAAFVAWDAPMPDSGAAMAVVPSWASWPSTHSVAGLFRGAREGAQASAEWALAALGQHEARVVLSAYPRAAAELAAFARVPHARRASEVRAFWGREAARGTRFELGDADVERALDGARVTLLACRERRGERWFPIGGPFQYRDVWLRDGARAIQALAVLGYGAESRQLAAGLRSLQWRWGAFMTQPGQPDGTGQALWAFEQATLRTPPDDSLEAIAAAAARAWRWCESQRRAMRALDPAHRPLMPPADPRDNELVRGQLTGTDAWTIAGYRSAARLAAAAGHAALADSIETSRREYAAAFMHAVAASGSRDVPAAWDRAARDWGNIAALYPCQVGVGAGVDSADWDRRGRALARRLWASGDDGLLAYGTADSLHGYLGADLGDWALISGEREAAERVLAGMLHWRSASGGWAELFSRSRRDFGGNLPPHATSAAAFITLLRNSVICDDGPRLMLTLGARDAWWRGARVRGAPTRWGPIDLAFTRHAETAEWTWTPVAVPTLLRLPPGTVVAAVSPPLEGVPGSDHVIAPPRSGHALVHLRAAPGPGSQPAEKP